MESVRERNRVKARLLVKKINVRRDKQGGKGIFEVKPVHTRETQKGTGECRERIADTSEQRPRRLETGRILQAGNFLRKKKKESNGRVRGMKEQRRWDRKSGDRRT